MSHRWAVCPSVLRPCRVPWHHHPGTLPPAAEKPTYVCYLTMIAHQKQSFKSFGPKGKKKLQHKPLIMARFNIYYDKIPKSLPNDFPGLFSVIIGIRSLYSQVTIRSKGFQTNALYLGFAVTRLQTMLHCMVFHHFGCVTL